MSKAKAATTNDNDIRILKEATCPTSSGKSTLTYQVGKDDSDAIYCWFPLKTDPGFPSNSDPGYGCPVYLGVCG